MQQGLITLSFGESSNLLALKYFDLELKKNISQENYIKNSTLFVGNELKTPNWLAFDFQENFDSLFTAFGTEESYNSEPNFSGMKTEKTVKDPIKPNPLFDFMKTSDMILGKRSILKHNCAEIDNFGLFSDGHD